MIQEREIELQTKIEDLRKLIRRINYESNKNYLELEQENIRLRDELQQMRLAYSVLDQNCERFQKAINYWRFMYEEEEEEEAGGLKEPQQKEVHAVQESL
jgi:hypothetical protein